MNKTQLIKKFGLGLSATLLMLPFNQLSASQYVSSQANNNPKIEVQIDQGGMRPCSISQYFICSIDLVWPDPTFGRLTITNISDSTIVNIAADIKPEITSYVFVSPDPSCSSVGPGEQCIIQMFLGGPPASPDSQLANITGNNMVLGQFYISIA